MRLIDADAMLKRLESWNTKDRMDKALYNFAHMRINEQPTIEPTKANCLGCKCSKMEQTQWIPVSERLPNDDEMSKCIYVNKYGDYIVDAYIHKVGSTYECENDYTILCDVIAWMPLPEPYKESEEE